jgi:hypothetical protein
VPDTPPPPLDFGLLDKRQEIMFHDGSAVMTHQVHIAGTPVAFLRAAQIAPGGEWIVFDLRHMAKSLANTLHGLDDRQAAGVIFQMLHMTYPSLDAFRETVRSKSPCFAIRNSEKSEVAA